MNLNEMMIKLDRWCPYIIAGHTIVMHPRHVAVLKESKELK